MPAITLSKVFRSGSLLLSLIGLFVAFFVTAASGAIPATERTVLVNIYNATNGAGWTYSTNWNGPAGSECSWYGVTCNAYMNHVFSINLIYNNLIGGPLPDLSDLTNLGYFDVSYNQLMGSIPSLSGLTNLYYFDISRNQLIGSIPSLSGLTKLYYFEVGFNQLTGQIPSLSGLINLVFFYANNNNLTGSIPSLSGLTDLRHVDVGFNQLTGPIPSLSDVPYLDAFSASDNNLTGSIPSFSGLSNLGLFDVGFNQLTGPIPSLSGLSNLQYFRVDHNQLTGTIPSLSGLTILYSFDVAYNQLTGDVPAVPSPMNRLIPGDSQLCPNDVKLTSDSSWDAATGSTPWYQFCVPYSVTYDGNGNTGGSVPDSSITHPTEIVTVLGNIGALYKSGDSFVGWNTVANGNGMWYYGGHTFAMGEADVTLYAQWTTATGYPVRILETLAGYTDIQSAYDNALDGQSIQAQDGLGSQNPLLFNNPHNYNPFYVKLSGGYNATVPPFTTDTGATLVIGSIEIRSGSIEIDKIIIQ